MRSVTLLAGLLISGVAGVEGGNACFEKCVAGSGTINLYGCGLTDADIPDLMTCFDVAGRGNIETLIVGNNGLTSIPEDTFEGLGSLTRLLLNGNQLSAVTPGVFAGLGSLQYLYLQDNQLSTLSEGLFDGLGSLKYLTVSQNELTSVSAGAFNGLGTLSNLYFTDNQLTTLPDGVFADLSNLKTLYLSKNADLQCVPTNVATKIKTDDISFDQCECTPAEAVMCDKGLACSPGEFGYTCGSHDAAASATQ